MESSLVLLSIFGSGSIVGSIIGFYFGSRKVKVVTNNIAHVDRIEVNGRILWNSIAAESIEGHRHSAQQAAGVPLETAADPQ